MVTRRPLPIRAWAADTPAGPEPTTIHSLMNRRSPGPTPPFPSRVAVAADRPPAPSPAARVACSAGRADAIAIARTTSVCDRSSRASLAKKRTPKKTAATKKRYITRSVPRPTPSDTATTWVYFGKRIAVSPASRKASASRRFQSAERNSSQ